MKQTLNPQFACGVGLLGAAVLLLAVWPNIAQNTPPEQRVSFPLSVSENSRYLVDSKGLPFLIKGDSPWEIAWQLTKADAEKYLENRRLKGFNAILVDGVPYSEWSDHVKETDRAGHNPFVTPGDFSTPNDAYFSHLEWLVETAGAKGILVLLMPADLGSRGAKFATKDGMWYQEYKSNGPIKCYQYGRYLGQRFSKHPNVLWVLGGDRDPRDVQEHIEEMARGLEETAPKQLKTYHAGARSSSLFFHDAPWLDINMSYGYSDPYRFVLMDYLLQPAKPVFLGESGYEGENLDERGGSPQRVRRQAYWAILSGACGHMYGSKAWGFRPGWEDSLDSPGAIHMSHLDSFFQSLPWHRLVPETEHAVLMAGFGRGTDRAITAWIPDGSLAITYMPSTRRVTVDLKRFNRKVDARWFDPTTGKYAPIEGSPFANTTQREFTPREKNGGGDSDFLLVLSTAHK